MMEKKNYQKELEAQLLALRGERSRLLLHSCCGPCSSYVLEYLSAYFQITVFYYNPNIHPREEYEKRLAAQRKLVRDLGADMGEEIGFLAGPYDPASFFSGTAGLEREPEGGARCAWCIGDRIEATARAAREHGFVFFTTTLSVSPHKNPDTINRAGEAAAVRHRVKYLFSDFKKRGGYARSVALSKKYGLYRQRYCGCLYSLPGERNRQGDGENES